MKKCLAVLVVSIYCVSSMQAGVFSVAKHLVKDGYHFVKHEVLDLAHGVKHAAGDIKTVAK